MTKKRLIIIGIVAFAIILLYVVTIGFIQLDRTLAANTVETWNKTHEAISNDKKDDTNIKEAMSNKESSEDKIIRKGMTGNSLCTFACNVDWGEEVIPDMLEIFNEYNVKVTFFVSGRWAENNPILLKKMFEDGHEIQSHGYSHALCSQVSSEKVKDEIEKTEKAIINAISIKPNFFAPPAGDYDERTVEIAESLGYTVVLWTSDTIDWRSDSTASVIIERIMKKPLDGSIILMHPKPETLKALPTLIERIKAEDYNIVPLYRMPL